MVTGGQRSATPGIRLKREARPGGAPEFACCIPDAPLGLREMSGLARVPEEVGEVGFGFFQVRRVLHDTIDVWIILENLFVRTRLYCGHGDVERAGGHRIFSQ